MKRLFGIIFIIVLFGLPVGLLGLAAEPPTPSWIKLLHTSDIDIATALTTDSTSNLYVAGSTKGNLNGEINGGNWDAFIVKYDSLGELQWTKLLGASGFDLANALTTDSSDNLYVAGRVDGDLNGENNNGDSDAFIVKYNSAGVLQWTKLLGANGDDEAYALTTDNSGNLYVAGSTMGGLEGETTNRLSAAFIVKYNAEGLLQWTKLLGTSDLEFATALTTDSMGNLYVAGGTMSIVNSEADSINSAAFLNKYDSVGTLQWTKEVGASDWDFAYALTTDSSGNLYIVGRTSGDLNGETNNGAEDVFIVKYNSAGALQWTKLLGTSGNDLAKALTTDNSGNLYVAGRTSGNLNGETNSGSPDAFLVKYDSAGVLQWTKLLGLSSVDEVNALTIDGSDNAYVAGGVSGNSNGKTKSGITDSDAFLVKF